VVWEFSWKGPGRLCGFSILDPITASPPPQTPKVVGAGLEAHRL
jgi:hypothetical protein